MIWSWPLFSKSPATNVWPTPIPTECSFKPVGILDTGAASVTLPALALSLEVSFWIVDFPKTEKPVVKKTTGIKILTNFLIFKLIYLLQVEILVF